MKISVIVPCFNAAADLPACIESLLASLLPGDQVIIVDDASTDATLAVARSLATDSRIVVNAIPHNVGVSEARNRGVNLAAGDVVGFVDPDDTVTAQYRSALLEPFMTHGVDITVGRHRVKDESRKIVRDAPYPDATSVISGPDSLALMAQRRLPSSVCFMAFHRSFLEKATPFRTGVRFEDFIFLADNLGFAHSVALAPVVVYTYRRGHVSETGALRRSVMDLLVGAEAIQNALRRHDAPDSGSLCMIADASIRVSVCDQAAVFGHQDPDLAREVLDEARGPFRIGLSLALVNRRRFTLAAQVSILRYSPALYGAIIRGVRRARTLQARGFRFARRGSAGAQ